MHTLASHPAAPGSIPSVAVAEVNQWRWLEESGQWLENVDRTHLGLASGKLVLQQKVGNDVALMLAMQFSILLNLNKC